MNQSQKAFAAILFGYLVFTTLKGNLGIWLQILGLRNERPALRDSPKIGAL